MHKISTAFLMRKPRKKSSDAVLVAHEIKCKQQNSVCCRSYQMLEWIGLLCLGEQRPLACSCRQLAGNILVRVDN